MNGSLRNCTVLVLAFLLVSCRFDYGEAPDARAPEDPPDFILRSMNYQVYMSDQSRVTFTGETGEFRDDEKKAYLRKVSFLQYDREGELVTRGYAAEAILDLNSEDAVLSGDVVIEALQENLVFTSERMAWDREHMTLTSSPGDMVTLQRSNGTITTGKGFTADLYRREFGFSRESRGVIYEEE